METEGSLLHSLVLKLHGVGNSLLSREHWWNDMDGKNRSARSKTCPSASFSVTNPTQTGLGSNLGLCCAADGVGLGTTQTHPQLRRMCFLPKYQLRSLLFDLYKVKKKKITRNCTQYCFAWVFLPFVHVVL